MSAAGFWTERRRPYCATLTDGSRPPKARLGSSLDARLKIRCAGRSCVGVAQETGAESEAFWLPRPANVTQFERFLIHAIALIGEASALRAGGKNQKAREALARARQYLVAAESLAPGA